jgi:hypothetical protein
MYLQEIYQSSNKEMFAISLSSFSRYHRADGAKRRARVLIPPGYLHPGKRKH